MLESGTKRVYSLRAEVATLAGATRSKSDVRFSSLALRASFLALRVDRLKSTSVAWSYDKSEVADGMLVNSSVELPCVS